MYTFNREQAVGAGGPARLDTTGAHVVTIRRALLATARTGTKGIEMDIEGEGGEEARYINVYTHRKGGEEIVYGIGTVQSMLAILNLPTLAVGQVHSRDGTSAEGFPPLIGKRIGMLLQRRLYTKGDGSDGSSLNLVMPFHPDTRQTAGELLERHQPALLDQRLAHLTDADEREMAARALPGARDAFPANAPSVAPPRAAVASGGALPFDDDIPFMPIEGIV